MKPALLLALLLLPFAVQSQLTFEEVTPPDDFCIRIFRKSPIGEYFIQTTNDVKSIYTSMNGIDWTKHVIEFSGIEDILFLTDGTPVLQSPWNEHIIRRNGTWFTLGHGSGWDEVYASFTKSDTLFIYQGNRFAYSVDKGQTYTVTGTYSGSIEERDSHLWAFGQHYVIHHKTGARDSLSVFTRQGSRIAAYEMDLGQYPNTLYNRCGELLFIDNVNYYRLQEQGLVFTTGKDTEIIPSHYPYTDLRTQDGNYYVRESDTLYISHGCTFDWQPYLAHELIDDMDFYWISQGEHIQLHDIHGNKFYEQTDGNNVWKQVSPRINYAMVLQVGESVGDRQVAWTYHSVFSKFTGEHEWTFVDSSKLSVYDIHYSPDGDLYIGRPGDLQYSADNGRTVITIAIPALLQSNFMTYSLFVLDNDILFLHKRFGDSYYSVNNGKDWTPVSLTDEIEWPIIKRVGNQILVADLNDNFYVQRIHLGTGDVVSHDIGNYSQLGSVGAMLDDGTMYFNGREVGNTTNQGLFRYRFGEIPQLLGSYSALSQKQLFASGNNVYAFGGNKYYLLTDHGLITYPFYGITPDGIVQYSVSENDHVYVTYNYNRIYRSIEPLSYPQQISGSIFHNRHEDCYVDTLDPRLKYWQVKVENDHYLRIHSSDNNGKFSIDVPEGDYTVSTRPINHHWEVCDSLYHVTIDSTSTRINQDFLATALDYCADLSIDFSTPLLRRCFENNYYIQVRNTGTEPSDGTIVRLELDPYFEFISATLPFTQIDDHIFEFALGQIDVSASVGFQVRFKVSCDAPLGIEHCLKGSLTDDNLCDNDRSSYTECQENVGSYDPNDKRVFNEAGYETERVDKGEYLVYHIRFQNTGTDTAFTVRIVDALAPTLDYLSIDVLSASHPYSFVLTDGPALDIVFPNIQLVDSTTNEPASHGFIKFRIKPLPEFDYGTSISNTAAIYFDFNDPVLTNTVATQILPEVKTVDPREFMAFDVFPNPATTNIQITMHEDDRKRVSSYEVVDLLGRQLMKINTLQGNLMDVSHLTPGMYCAVLRENGVVIGMKQFVRL